MSSRSIRCPWLLASLILATGGGCVARPTPLPVPTPDAGPVSSRHDPATARLIAGHSSIGSVQWVLEAPGIIDLGYLASCTGSLSVAAPGTRVAEDGACVDALRVRVDVAAARVLETVRIPDS